MRLLRRRTPPAGGRQAKYALSRALLWRLSRFRALRNRVITPSKLSARTRDSAPQQQAWWQEDQMRHRRRRAWHVGHAGTLLHRHNTRRRCVCVHAHTHAHALPGKRSRKRPVPSRSAAVPSTAGPLKSSNSARSLRRATDGGAMRNFVSSARYLHR